MKTNIEKIAAITAVAIWADGEYDPAEEITVEEIAEALELDIKEFKGIIDKQYADLQKMTDNQVNAFLLDAADAVEEDEAGIIFEAAMQMILADSVLSRKEVSHLFGIANALGIEAEDTVLLLADMVKEEEELEIDFEN